MDPADPNSAPTSIGDLHLQRNSPAIDAGDITLIPAGVNTGLDRKPRSANNKVAIDTHEVLLYLYLPTAARRLNPMPVKTLKP